MTKVKLSIDREGPRGMCGAGCVVEYDDDEATEIINAGEGVAVVKKQSKRRKADADSIKVTKSWRSD